MQAHRLKITIPESREVTVRLPVDVPAGQAEVIILSGDAAEPAVQTVAEPTSFDKRFPRDTALGPVVFHEDPTAPLSDDEWPSHLRP